MRRLALLGLLPLLAGCAARRSLDVTSSPPGALVRLDGEPVGRTPVSVLFHYYGTRRVTLYKRGFETHSQEVELQAPWYFRFPIDIVSEVLLPFGWRDRRHYHVDLVAGEELLSPPSLRSVIERADFLRNAGPEGPRGLPAPRPVELPPGASPVRPPTTSEPSDPPVPAPPAADPAEDAAENEDPR